MRCLGCDYNLKNLPDHRCPECGRKFDPHDPDTFDHSEPVPYDWTDRVALVLLAIFIVMAIALAVLALG